jgi:hypothetical protein
MHVLSKEARMEEGKTLFSNSFLGGLEQKWALEGE